MKNLENTTDVITENMKNQYYSVDFFSTHENFDAIEVLESKGEEFLFQNLIFLFSHYNSSISAKKQLENAFLFAKEVHKKQRRESGAAFITHPLIVALLSLPYKPCVDFLSATLLHDTIEDYEEEGVLPVLARKKISEKVKKIFGETVYTLIEGVSKVSDIDCAPGDEILKKHTKEERTKKTIEKIFHYAKQDCRILLIKIFDRLHNIITIAGKKNAQKRKKKVQEAIFIYVASAKRLGIWSLKNLLENACARALHIPIDNSDINEDSQMSCITTLSSFFPDAHIFFEYNSFMNRKKRDKYLILELEDEKDCFMAFSRLNTQLYLKKYTFLDYISRPKINKYQALHAQYILNNSEIIEVHIVSKKMYERNTIGAFIDVYNKEYKLEELSNRSLSLLHKESEQTLDSITNNLLTPQLTIHNPEYGKNYIARGATALDAGILLYPDRFQNISTVRINTHEKPLDTIVKNNDIIEFSFSNTTQLKRPWLNSSLLYKEKISEMLSCVSYDEKLEKGHNILQAVFDEKRMGSTDTLCDTIDFLRSTDVNCSSIEELYVRIYEGRIGEYECLYLYEEYIKNKSHTKKKQSVKKQKLHFSSSFSLFSDVESVVLAVAEKTSVDIKNLTMKKERKEIKGSMLVESSKKNIITFVQNIKPSLMCSYATSISFLLKIAFFLAFPIGISVLIFTLLISGLSENHFLFYFGAGFILAANVSTYIFLNNYFAAIRNKISVLLSIIAINFIVSLGYIYIFFQHNYDIYNLNFYFPLILLVFSMGLPAIFVSQKKIANNKTPSITLSEYQKKQKEKIIGYFLRIGAVIIWGIEPLIIRYSPLSDIRFDLQAPLLLLGASIFTFLSVLFLGKKAIQKNYKLKIDWYFIAMMLSMLSLILFLILSSQSTSGTSFILLNGFAPILALLIGFIFWKSTTSYFNERGNIIKMFIIFLLGGVGASLIFYKDLVSGSANSLMGNIYAICYMFADVIFVTAQIQYTKKFRGNEAYFLNFYLYFISFLCSLPLVLYSYSYFIELPFISIFWAVGLGALWGLGTLLTFEAYKRMDGFIAFLMFNIAILITIFVESFILGEIKITSHLMWGTSLIIGASILAEMINTKCEKKQIKK